MHPPFSMLLVADLTGLVHLARCRELVSVCLFTEAIGDTLPWYPPFQTTLFCLLEQFCLGRSLISDGGAVLAPALIRGCLPELRSLEDPC